jgi:hypothetical protein
MEAFCNVEDAQVGFHGHILSVCVKCDPALFSIELEIWSKGVVIRCVPEVLDNLFLGCCRN